MKTVIEMAREAQIVPYVVWPTNSEYIARLERFAELVRADEREIQAEAFQQILAATRNVTRADERARMAEQPAPVQKEPLFATEGKKLILVDESFDDLMYWLERCEDKGHLENCPDLVEPWKNFSYEAYNSTPQTQPAQPQQEPVAWVPYLSDRADGVKGHYAIARLNPRGYREVWNLRRHAWGAYSDDVLSLEEADTLLRLIEIPTRKVEAPQPAPVQKEWIETACALIKAADDAAHDRDYMLDSNDCIRVLRGEWKGGILNDCPPAPQPAQRKPLTNEGIESIYAQETGSLISDSPWSLIDFARAIEAKHGIKEQP